MLAPDARPPLPRGPYLVAGLGRAGRGAVAALVDAVGPENVRAWDTNTGASMRRVKRELEAAGVETLLAPGLTRREVGQSWTIVKSPGIPFMAPVIQRALGKGRTVIDELELGWRLSRSPVLAVTGTNGTSPVSGLVTAVLSAAGRSVRLAGNTEFGPPLSEVASQALDWIVCEVSSFQLEGCVHMLPELAVFTNLTHEHLGRHGTMERYGQVKRRLFLRQGRVVPRAVIDIDGSFGRRLADDVEACGGAVTRVGFSDGADYVVESAAWDLRAAETRLRTPSGRVSALSSLPGAYNARNIAAALAVADVLGVEHRIAVPTIRAYAGTPGRFEHVDAGQPFEVIVDYAHTPDALEQMLMTTRTGMRPGGRITVVFGLGGMPGTAMAEMGGVVRRFSDRLILTTSGFRGTPPMLALSSILSGARSATGGELDVVLDRRRAIERAVLSAAPDDVIVIPGRGRLPDLRADPRGVPIPFDDRQVARELLSAVAHVIPRAAHLSPSR